MVRLFPYVVGVEEDDDIDNWAGKPGYIKQLHKSVSLVDCATEHLVTSTKQQPRDPDK